ncbi:hypothetical protein K3495_g11026 [Podosphaera aphanis]|nr:hypothetical protein K3495_g11026 [Podosphaera aphanis]
MGDLCFRCEELGHRRPNYKSKPLEPWEQDHLKEMTFHGFESNFAGFGGSTGSFRYREIQDSNWRYRSEDISEDKKVHQSRKETKNSNPREEDIPHLTCEEYDGSSCKGTSPQSARCMSVIIGLKEEENTSSKSTLKEFGDEGVTLESNLNASNLKKRARPMEMNYVLNEDEKTAKFPKKTAKRERRAMKQLREIVGRFGKGPVD